MVSLRLADVVDVLVIAVLLYVLLNWFRRRGTHAIAITLLLLAGLYAVAQLLNMYLTLMLFRVGLTALLLALLLAFQSDIRRGLERLVSTRWIRKIPAPAHPRSQDVIVESVAQLAEQRIGGLLVVAGRESLDRHLRGGVELDGAISGPLLHSLFHPESSGHDGAVVIEENRVRRFAVHLPLSTDFNQLDGTGTRHAAALGMSERSDALLIVVSEERGTIAVAENGRLSHDVSSSELSGRLEQHLAQLDELHQQPRGWSTWLLNNAGLKVASLLLASLLWFLLAYQADIVQRVYVNVPVEYRNLPANWAVVDFAPENVRITLTGRERAFSEFDFRRLIVSLDLRNIREGSQEIPVTEGMLDLPDDILLRQTDRPVIRLTAYEMVMVELPVRVAFEPTLQRQPAIRVEPSHVELLVRRLDQKRWQEISTEPVPLEQLQRADRAVTIPLKLPPHARLADGMPSSVRVQLTEPSSP